MVNAIVQSISTEDSIRVKGIILGRCTQPRYLRGIKALFPVFGVHESSGAGHVTNVPVSGDHHGNSLSHNPAPSLAVSILSASSGRPPFYQPKEPEVVPRGKKVAEPPLPGIIDKDSDSSRCV